MTKPTLTEVDKCILWYMNRAKHISSKNIFVNGRHFIFSSWAESVDIQTHSAGINASVFRGLVGRIVFTEDWLPYQSLRWREMFRNESSVKYNRKRLWMLVYFVPYLWNISYNNLLFSITAFKKLISLGKRSQDRVANWWQNYFHRQPMSAVLRLCGFY